LRTEAELASMMRSRVRVYTRAVNQKRLAVAAMAKVKA